MIPNNNQSEFRISDYIDLLGDKAPNGQYICPNCKETKLSISKNGVKYDCYGCHDTKKIAYQLRLKRGEFDKFNKVKSESSKQTSLNENDKQTKKSKIAESIDILKQLYHNLRFNEIDKEIYLGDKLFHKKVCNPERLYIKLAQDLNKDFAKNTIVDSLFLLAENNTFNPLLDDFNEKANEWMNMHDSPFDAQEKAEKIISNLSSQYLGTNNNLYNIYLKKWLMSAVARIFNAGCYTRCVLILQGNQNAGKTSFFRILGRDYFSSSLGDLRTNQKDEILIAHRNWILEWGELEVMFSRKAMGEVKRQVTIQEDSIRYPYSRSPVVIKRQFVFCGTTNETEFLKDKTGNSRFWVIPVEKIDLTKWAKNRDMILSATAFLIRMTLHCEPHLITTGKLWELDEEELEASDENSKQFEEKHPYEDVIDDLIEAWDNGEAGAGWIQSSKIYDALDISKKEEPRHRNVIKQIMNQRGYVSKLKKIGKKPIRIWKKETRG